LQNTRAPAQRDTSKAILAQLKGARQKFPWRSNPTAQSNTGLQITVKLHVQAQQRNMDAAIAM